MTSAQIKTLLVKFNCNSPVNSAMIRTFKSESCFHLPDDYTAFLEVTNGGEGFIGNAYLILWRIEELVELNKAYHTSEYVPGLFVFGSDGGGEAFAFDIRSDDKQIVSVPFVGMALALARPIAPNFIAFLQELSKC
jgi:hypothetical protein